jgi:hypothetical protein
MGVLVKHYLAERAKELKRGVGQSRPLLRFSMWRNWGAR